MAKQKPAKKPSSKLKKVLIAGLVLVGFAAISQTASLFHSAFGGEVINSIGQASFSQQLPVPPLAQSSLDADGARVFSLELKTGTRAFLPGAATNTWGINGDYLGPTLRAKKGEKVRVEVTNNLPEDTSIHWHGMHLPAKMDGGPHQPVLRDATWSPEWTIKQPAATLWYHPHPHGQTETHVYRGIAGMFIIDDDETPTSLPHEYGVDDLPVIVQDKKFDKNNQFAGGKNGDGGPMGTLGNEIIVNGALTPHFEATTQRVRLRLLNGSTARIYNFGLSNSKPMQVIATDGGLLETPVDMERLRLSPGERAEVIIEVSPGEQINLQSHPMDLGTQFVSDKLVGASDSLDIMQIRGAATLLPSAPVPDRLATITRLTTADATATRQLRLSSDSTINDKPMDLKRVDFAVTRGETEVWDVANHDGLPHSFHIHDVQFQILSIGDAAPPPELSGWKDTVLILPRQEMRLIMKFTDYSDPAFPYMYHCHLLRHEDQGMMGQFVVIEPGAEAPQDLPANHHAH